MNHLPQQKPDGAAKRIADKIVPLTAFSKSFPCWLQFLSKCYPAFIECVNLLHPAAPRLAAAPSVLEALREACDWRVALPPLQANDEVIWQIHVSFVIFLFEETGVDPE